MVQQFELNCTEMIENVLNCSSPVENKCLSFSVATWTILILSAIGFILNLMASYIFVFSMKIGDIRFVKLLRIYTFNCMLINLNDTVVCILTIIETFYINRVFRFALSEFNQAYFTYFSSSFWALTYTFSGLLDLLIVYERILIHLPGINFLRHRSVSGISFGAFVYAMLINVPIFISWDYEEIQLNFNGNTTVAVYALKFKEYQYQNVFLAVFYTILGIRDILQLIFDICINSTLIVIVIRYYKKKSSLSVHKQRSSTTIKNNTNIAFIHCIISSIVHLAASIPIISTTLNLSAVFYTNSIMVLGVFNGLKHSSNFFCLVILNKKFRDVLFMNKDRQSTHHTFVN